MGRSIKQGRHNPNTLPTDGVWSSFLKAADFRLHPFKSSNILFEVAPLRKSGQAYLGITIVRPSTLARNRTQDKSSRAKASLYP